jgi:hypothetical protein
MLLLIIFPRIYPKQMAVGAKNFDLGLMAAAEQTKK